MCLPVLSAGIGLVGSVVQGVGQARATTAEAVQQRAQAVSTAQDFIDQAALHARQAEMDRISGSFDAKRMQEKADQFIGNQVASFASNGVDVSSGTIAHIVRESGKSAGLDIAAARYSTRTAIDNEGILARINRSRAAETLKLGFAAASDTAGAARYAFAAPVLAGSATFLKSAFAA